MIMTATVSGKTVRCRYKFNDHSHTGTISGAAIVWCRVVSGHPKNSRGVSHTTGLRRNL